MTAPTHSPGPAGSAPIGDNAEAATGDSPSVPSLGKPGGLGEDLATERARLLHQYKTEHIDDAVAASFVGIDYTRRPGYPTPARVAEWSRDFRTLVDRERQERAAVVARAAVSAVAAGVDRVLLVAPPTNTKEPSEVAPAELRTAEALDLVEAYMLRGERPRVDLGEVVRVLRVNLEAEPEPEWGLLHDGDGLVRVDEGNTYLFAIETNSGWKYFEDAIVWDSESDPRWYDGDAGWEINDVSHFRTRLTPPKAVPPATTVACVTVMRRRGGRIER